jgi:hypothetical protein
VIVATLVLAAAGLYWFQPWRLFTSTTVNEAAPVVVVAPSATSPSATSPSITSARPGTAGPSAAAAILVAEGSFVTHEHDTTGRAQLVRLPSGAYQLVLRDLATSDGPDLRVWLTDRAVTADGWHSFDDGRHVELGRLKADHGTQVYNVPTGVDVAGYRSVTIWCARFSVSFGAAALA